MFAGFEYTPDQGTRFINELAIVPPTATLSKLEGEATASLVVYVLPVITLKVAYIGDVTVGIKPFLELSAMFGTNKPDACPEEDTAMLSLKFGVALTIGGGMVMMLMMMMKSMLMTMAIAMKLLTYGLIRCDGESDDDDDGSDP